MLAFGVEKGAPIPRTTLTFPKDMSADEGAKRLRTWRYLARNGATPHGRVSPTPGTCISYVGRDAGIERQCLRCGGVRSDSGPEAYSFCRGCLTPTLRQPDQKIGLALVPLLARRFMHFIALFR
ncbi:MAG: hypothetical protein Q8R13_02465 [bacterium]|nr:hypothetical protein [bacterium]